MSMSKRKCLKRDEYFECISLKIKAMTVGELKILLEGIDDHVEGLIPVNMDEADGFFYSPCFEMSGEIESNVDGLEDLEFITERSFLLVPCGFFGELIDDFDEMDEEINPELN